MTDWLIAQLPALTLACLALIVLKRCHHGLSATVRYRFFWALPLALLINQISLPGQHPAKQTLTTFVVNTQAQFAQFDWQLLVSVIWLGVAMLLLTAWLIEAVAGYLKIRPLARHTHAATGLTYSESNSAHSPYLIGFFAPRLMLPKGFISSTSSAEQAPIFAHEAVHYQRRDVVANTFFQALLCVFWFHPLVWLAYRDFRTLQELSVDEAVTEQFTDKERLHYGKALLAFAVYPSAHPSMSPLYGDKHTMLERLKQLKNPNRSNPVAITFAAVGLALMLGMSTTDTLAGQSEYKAKHAKEGAEIMPLTRVEPKYPVLAAKKNINGSVVLEFDILPSGKTANIKVISAKPEQTFNKAAKVALKKWQYQSSAKGYKKQLVQLDFVIDESQLVNDKSIEKIRVSGK